MDSNLQDIWSTKDLNEAAACLCKSAKLLRLQKGDNFSWFVFSDKNFCEKISNEYWSGECLVNAKSFSDALRTLKDRLFAQKSNFEGR